MNKNLICILCPQGCPINVDYSENELGAIKVISVDGSKCSRGEFWAREEVENPVRTVTSSIRVLNGELPLVSVRTDKPIPKKRIFDVMNVIKTLKVKAPVKRGQIIVENILGLNANLIATRTVNRVNGER
ncbi:MAG: DUF1667 domain-containing protein [Candidatus Odinarchaeum yellowstonii]|uniref:DUF1667 domain-containing protein n=1 Tax=Odinarchaeota yellowstonii (strain LCB_4) TaxID=1841599 RepID=A0AAF0IB73_ODILC|nr:MAG: DUF1667 domain-containing protein [Candidatus Odinarchaeum yellowstonii]